MNSQIQLNISHGLAFGNNFHLFRFNHHHKYKKLHGEVSMEQEKKSRLWGNWKIISWKSGNVIVHQKELPNKPWLSVYADPLPSDHDQAKNRLEMCKQLADWLNGGKRPIWLDDFERLKDDYLISLTGAEIFATGPVLSFKSSKTFWELDDSKKAKEERKLLLDILLSKE